MTNGHLAPHTDSLCKKAVAWHAFLLMNILYISTAIPPYPESHTIRNAFFIRALSSAGHQVDVLTCLPCACDPTLQNIWAGATPASTISTPCPALRAGISYLLNSQYLRIAGRAAGYCCNYIVAPDLYRGWSRLATDAIGIPQKQYRLIVSASGSYDAHIAAAKLSSRLSVPFIADLGDPWSDNPIWPSPFLLKRIQNMYFEKRSLGNAAAITVTTQETADVLRAKYPRVPCHVIPMGFNRQDFTQQSVVSRGSLLYAGVAFKGDRNLLPLVNALGICRDEVCDSVHLKIVGPQSKAFQAKISSLGLPNAKALPRVTYQESIDQMNRSELLVLIGNRGGLQIPGKVYMYLATGRPILYLQNSDVAADPTLKLLDRFDGVYPVANDPHAIAALIKRLMPPDRALNAVLPYTDRLDDFPLTEFDWERLGALFLAIATQYASSDCNHNFSE